MTLFLRSRTLLTALLFLGLTAGLAPAAQATEEPLPTFYVAPAELPAGPGQVIRSEPSTYAVDPAQISSLSITATRVLYTSTDLHGAPIAVSGAVIVPTAPWIGLGTRPVIGYAPGTQGMADRCAPSRQRTSALEYEDLMISGLLARGYAIAMTDYQGLGTAGIHHYMNRVEQGHAVLDIVRAAQRLSGAGLTSSSPVGIAGYSQGGGGAAAAAELAPSYAAELKVKGASVGAVPADLAAVGRNLDGSMYAAFGLYALRGLSDAYAIDYASYLNPTGVQQVESVEDGCVTDLFTHSFLDSTTLTNDGRSLSELMAEPVSATRLAENRIGRLKPAVPVLVNHSLLDDTIPYAVGRQLAKDWCSLGANVTLNTTGSVGHVGGMLDHVNATYAFFEARFAGLPQVSNCWLL